MDAHNLIILSLIVINIGLIILHLSVKKELNEEIQKQKSGHKLTLEKTIQHISELHERIDNLQDNIRKLFLTLEQLTESINDKKQ